MTTFTSGRGNLACTIFVPYDCDNNCPFCTSKAMYGELKDSFNVEEIINKINLLNYNDGIKEYVLTGGEPLANLPLLKRIVNAMAKKCFINTTLPAYAHIDEAIDYINNEPKIAGINISRHLNYKFDGPTSTNDKLDMIQKNIRINTILPTKLDHDKLMKFIADYSRPTRLINLRADYRKIDTTTLKDRNHIVDFLAEHFNYMGTTTCLVCNSEFFAREDGNQICYHRGLQYSSYQVGNKCYVNDVLITPDGKIYKDWDFSTEDEEFNAWIFKPTTYYVTMTCRGKITYFKGFTDDGGVEFTKDISCAKNVLNEQINDIFEACGEDMLSVFHFNVVRI